MIKMIKKILLVHFLLIFVISFNSAFAGSNDTLYLSLSNLEDLAKACTTGSFWHFQPGDNMEWADPDYDDSDWSLSKTYVAYNDFQENDIHRLGWYRLHLKVDSSLWNQNIGIKYAIIGAFEIYLNGNLIFTKGEVGSSAEDEIAHYSSDYSNPINIYLGSKSSQVIAVRFSAFNESLIQNIKIAIAV